MICIQQPALQLEDLFMHRHDQNTECLKTSGRTRINSTFDVVVDVESYATGNVEVLKSSYKKWALSEPIPYGVAHLSRQGECPTMHFWNSQA